MDRAALDVSIELGISCGGWCPRDRLAEDGVIPDHYPLTETSSAEYEERTEWNVRDSDGTLIIVHLPPTGGTAYTIEAARKQGRPYLVIDLDEIGASDKAWADGVVRIRQWLVAEGIEVLNVAGPRESKVPGIRQEASDILRLILQADTTTPAPTS